MLVRGQTTEERIAEIAQGFGQGVNNFNIGQDRQRSQSLQDEALRRQKAMQEFEIENKLSESTGRNVYGSGIGTQVMSGNSGGFGEILNKAPMTPKHEAAQKKLERENLKHEGVMEEINYKREQRALPLEQRDSYREKIAAKLAGKNNGGFSLTKGEEKVDTDYAKDINDWTATGRANLSKNLQSLKEARDALDNDKSLTGGLTGALPDRLTANRVLAQRQRVGSAVQGSLRATLGSSFTEGEGNRTLANSYNEAADAKTNKASLERLITELETQATVNDQRSEYFRKNGTLKGFQVEDSVSSQQAAPVNVSPEVEKRVKSYSPEQIEARKAELRARSGSK